MIRSHGISPSLGTLNVKLFVTDQKQVHYGSGDPILGNIILKYIPKSQGGSSSGQEVLFGPLQLDVVLRGTTRIHRRHNEPPEVEPLFTKTARVFDGAFECVAYDEHNTPFSFRFPNQTAPKKNTKVAAVQDENGQWNFVERISGIDVNELPPSLQAQIPDSLAVGPIEATQKTLLTVQYKLSVQAKMPGIDVDIQVIKGKDGETILYDQPMIPMSMAAQLALVSEFSQQCTVQSEDLRPVQDRPQGFRGKTKALLRATDLPKYVFTASCSDIPQHVFVGQPISFDLSIATHFSSTTETHPGVFIESCTITLLGHTTGVDYMPTLIESIKSKEADVVSSDRPFSDQDGWTKNVDVGTLSWVPSTFTFGKISRTYKLRIQCGFTCGPQKMNLRRDVPITVHPPLNVDEKASDSASSAPPVLPRMNSAGSGPPPYEEIDSTPSQRLYGSSDPHVEATSSATGFVPVSYEQAVASSGRRHHNAAASASTRSAQLSLAASSSSNNFSGGGFSGGVS